MFSWLKSVISFNSQEEQEVVNRFVAKNMGQRGPLIALIPTTHKNESICLCVTPCSVFVFFWEAAPLGKRLSLEDDAFTCAASLRGSAVVAGTQKGQVCEVRLDDSLAFRSGQFRHSISDTPVSAIACTRDGTRVAAGFADGTIALWTSPADEPELLRGSEIPAAVTALVFVESTNALWAGYADSTVSVLYLESIGNFVKIPTLCKLPAVMRWHSYMNVVVVSDSNAEVVVVSVSDHNVLHRYDASLVTCGAALSCLEILGERQLLLLGATDGSFCVRELLASEKSPQKLRCHLLRVWEVPESDAGPVTCAAVDAATDTLLVGDAGCRVRSVGDFAKKINDVDESLHHV
jgi:hypothetical protein